MSLEKLKQELDTLVQKLSLSTNLLQEIELVGSIFPFNDYEYIISHLLSQDILSLEEYKILRQEYIARVPNLFLYNFAGKTFGAWAESYVLSLSSSFIKPTKKHDANYKNEYDMVIINDNHIIKVEVKASRVTDLDGREELVERALSKHDSKSFDMNFQQLKVRCADVFVFLIVWTDKIEMLVLNKDEISNSRFYSDKQHRGNVGEGQLHINQRNIKEFATHIVEPSQIYPAIIKSYNQLIK
jgi:hypothetical protein